MELSSLPQDESSLSESPHQSCERNTRNNASCAELHDNNCTTVLPLFSRARDTDATYERRTTVTLQEPNEAQCAGAVRCMMDGEGMQSYAVGCRTFHPLPYSPAPSSFECTATSPSPSSLLTVRKPSAPVGVAGSCSVSSDVPHEVVVPLHHTKASSSFPSPQTKKTAQLTTPLFTSDLFAALLSPSSSRSRAHSSSGSDASRRSLSASSPLSQGGTADCIPYCRASPGPSCVASSSSPALPSGHTTANALAPQMQQTPTVTTHFPSFSLTPNRLTTRAAIRSNTDRHNSFLAVTSDEEKESKHWNDSHIHDRDCRNAEENNVLFKGDDAGTGVEEEPTAARIDAPAHLRVAKADSEAKDDIRESSSSGNLPLSTFGPGTSTLATPSPLREHVDADAASEALRRVSEALQEVQQMRQREWRSAQRKVHSFQHIAMRGFQKLLGTETPLQTGATGETTCVGHRTLTSQGTGVSLETNASRTANRLAFVGSEEVTEMKASLLCMQIQQREWLTRTAVQRGKQEMAALWKQLAVPWFQEVVLEGFYIPTMQRLTVLEKRLRRLHERLIGGPAFTSERDGLKRKNGASFLCASTKLKAEDDDGAFPRAYPRASALRAVLARLTPQLAFPKAIPHQHNDEEREDCRSSAADSVEPSPSAALTSLLDALYHIVEHKEVSDNAGSAKKRTSAPATPVVCEEEEVLKAETTAPGGLPTVVKKQKKNNKHKLGLRKRQRVTLDEEPNDMEEVHSKEGEEESEITEAAQAEEISKEPVRALHHSTWVEKENAFCEGSQPHHRVTLCRLKDLLPWWCSVLPECTSTLMKRYSEKYIFFSGLVHDQGKEAARLNMESSTTNPLSWRLLSYISSSFLLPRVSSLLLRSRSIGHPRTVENHSDELSTEIHSYAALYAGLLSFLHLQSLFLVWCGDILTPTQSFSRRIEPESVTTSASNESTPLGPEAPKHSLPRMSIAEPLQQRMPGLLPLSPLQASFQGLFDHLCECFLTFTFFQPSAVKHAKESTRLDGYMSLLRQEQRRAGGWKEQHEKESFVWEDLTRQTERRLYVPGPSPEALALVRWGNAWNQQHSPSSVAFPCLSGWQQKEESKGTTPNMTSTMMPLSVLTASKNREKVLSPEELDIQSETHLSLPFPEWLGHFLLQLEKIVISVPQERHTMASFTPNNNSHSSRAEERHGTLRDGAICNSVDSNDVSGGLSTAQATTIAKVASLLYQLWFAVPTPNSVAGSEPNVAVLNPSVCLGAPLLHLLRHPSFYHAQRFP